jgi:hypothetical protein
MRILRESSNYNGITISSATLRNLIVKHAMFPDYNIHKYTWTSSDGEMHNQVDHVLINKRQHSSII